LELYDAVVSRVCAILHPFLWVELKQADADGLTLRDVHWFNTVKISRSAVESSLGPNKVDQKARNFFILGASLSALFDIATAPDFLRALLKLLEEWESWTEGNTGGKGVVRRGRFCSIAPE